MQYAGVTVTVHAQIGGLLCQWIRTLLGSAGESALINMYQISVMRLKCRLRSTRARTGPLPTPAVRVSLVAVDNMRPIRLASNCALGDATHIIRHLETMR